MYTITYHVEMIADEQTYEAQTPQEVAEIVKEILEVFDGYNIRIN